MTPGCRCSYLRARVGGAPGILMPEPGFPHFHIESILNRNDLFVTVIVELTPCKTSVERPTSYLGLAIKTAPAPIWVCPYKAHVCVKVIHFCYILWLCCLGRVIMFDHLTLFTARRESCESLKKTRRKIFPIYAVRFHANVAASKVRGSKIVGVGGTRTNLPVECQYEILLFHCNASSRWMGSPFWGFPLWRRRKKNCY